MISNEQFVLIRGLFREARHWGKFIEELEEQFPGVNTLTPDIPGNGQLHNAASPKTIAGMTDALRSQVPVRDQLKLVALSMGGMIAIDWMTRYPEEIASAVLVNTSVRPISPFYQRLRWVIYPQIIKMMFHSAPQRERDILTLSSNKYRHDKKLLDNWKQWQQECPVSTHNARNQLCAAARFSITSKPQQPVLIVTSQTDRLVDYRCGANLAKLWRTDHAMHETAGHDLPLDEPAWLANTIRNWRMNKSTNS
ncbi:MAG: alpha/beta hydrolase [Betaproteobacteria bacterium]|nr:alpha/beta hydrolase [Betaproteobacteria bacterium]